VSEYVEVVDRVGGIGDLEDEVGERREVGLRDLHIAPEQVREPDAELHEGGLLVEQAAIRWALGASLAPERSPRQCIGPWFAIPRRLCVVIGPFIG